MKVVARIILAMLVAGGFAIGRLTAPTKVETETITITETVEVPVYIKEELPKVEDITYYDVPLSKSLQRYIHEISADNNVPVSLVMAIIEHESGFNPEAVSPTDDYGLMQINKINHEWLAKDYRCVDMLDPYQNVFAGVKIIGRFVEKYDGDYGRALMAYNLGDYGAKKAVENGITSTKYSAAIYNLMMEYEGEYNDK
jgi:soluble lytic murein transglycosylase-like protein